jgi:hypothetical protein
MCRPASGFSMQSVEQTKENGLEEFLEPVFDDEWSKYSAELKTP